VRIAVIAPPWVPVPPPAYGGTEAVIDGLTRSLAEAGHDVFLFATGDSPIDVPLGFTYAEAIGVEEARPTHELLHVVRAYEHPKVRQADVVHDHTTVGPAYGAPRVGCPVVTTAHGPFRSELGPCYEAFAHDVALVAISHHQAQLSGDVPVAAVIHHGLDVEAIPVGAGDGGYALFLGRIHPDKGVATACRIARQVGIPLVIAAKMTERLEQEYFDAEVRPLLSESIEYVGELGGADKYELLGGALCLLNPIAWDEPFGMVMVESLACGTPVVATPRGSVPELITDGWTGVVAPAPELADRLTEVKALERPECRREAEQRFSRHRLAADHVRLYERLVNERRRQPGRTSDNP
jgi:glycosyltransferase involved in cell wall biosynthesis